MSKTPVVQVEESEPPKLAFLDDGRYFELAAARRWEEPFMGLPQNQLCLLPGPEPTWFMIDGTCLMLNVASAKWITPAQAATFILQNGFEVPDELKEAAEALRFDPSKRAARLTPSQPRPQSDSRSSDARHSVDFRCVCLGCKEYTFSPTQARCVEIMWKASENGTPEMGQQAILEAAESRSTRLREVFKNSSAWGTLIVRGKKRGTYRLDLTS
jgi:hypothetical protein